MRRPLSGQDAAWLRVETPENPMTIAALLELRPALAPERLLELLSERLTRFPRFRERVTGGTKLTPYAWERDPSFSVARHVEHVVLGDAPFALEAAVQTRVRGTLDRTRPLWRMALLESPGRTHLLARVHHCIADGFALLRVLLSLTEPGPSLEPSTDEPRRVRGDDARWRRPMAVVREAGKYVAGATRLLLLPREGGPYRGRALSGEKLVAWTGGIPTAALKSAGRAFGATLNDVLLAGVAGGLRRHARAQGDVLPTSPLRAMVPFNLRGAASVAGDELGNRFGLVVVDLPAHVDDSLERLFEVKHAMAALKAGAEPALGLAVVSSLGWMPGPILRMGLGFFSAKASAVLTNVPGPRHKLRLAGATLERVLFWVPQSGSIGLGISLFSYAGEVAIGVMADAARVPEPRALTQHIEAELAVLLAEAEGAARAGQTALSPRRAWSCLPKRGPVPASSCLKKT